MDNSKETFSVKTMAKDYKYLPTFIWALRVLINSPSISPKVFK